MCNATGVKLEFLPPYSPDFNPIEEAFAEMKAWMRKNYVLQSTYDTFEGFWAQRWCTYQEKPATTSVVLISQWIYDDDVQGIKIDTFLSSSNASGCQALPLSFARCHFHWFDVKSILIPWLIPNVEYKSSVMSFKVPYIMFCAWSVLKHCCSCSAFVQYVCISH